VRDVVEAVIALADREQSYGEVFNVGSQEEISIRELAQRVIRTTGSHSEIALIPYSEAYQDGFEDMHRRVPDISKVAQAIGWRPTRTLDEIIFDVAGVQPAAALG
jgi:UDP-glucose 4-epimerase